MAKLKKLDNKNTKTETRYRNYTTVVYPESAPSNWRDILLNYHIPAFISPLHDKDFNPNGKPKKPHWHVMLMFDNVKARHQVQAIFSEIKGVGCEVVKSVRGCARYLCHLDNPDKAQYSPNDVVCLSGADYCQTCSLVSDKYKSIGEMMDFCDENEIISYAQLLRYCKEFRPSWFRTLCDNGTFVMKAYLKSQSWTKNTLGQGPDTLNT